jgi:cytochrome P450
MRSVRHAVEEINTAVYHIVRQRHGRTEDAPANLLSLLMNARDDDGSAMTDEQVRDEVMTFLLAGHETTALALCWALYLLSREPAAERKLHDELDRVLGSRLPAISDLPLLVYCENVMKETMRLYPPAWSVARTAIEDFELEGYRIPGGSNVVMSQWIMHRDARYFPDPERFDPDRWETAACRNLPKFAYFPFGGGPRQCIGSSFAMTEAVLLLACFARKFRLVSVDASSVQPVPSLTLRPKGTIAMRIESRH